MAQKSDGTIYINTSIDADGFTAGGKEIENAVKRMSNSVTGIGKNAELTLQKQVNSFVKANQAVGQQQQKVESLRKKLEELRKQKIQTEEYKRLEKEVETLDSEMEKVINKQKDLMSLGFNEDEAYRVVAQDIEKIGAEMDKVIDKQKQMKAAGTAYKTPDTNTAEQNLASAEQKLEQMQSSLGISYDSLKLKTESYSNTLPKTTQYTKMLQSAQTKLKSILSKTVSTIKKATTQILGLNKNTKKSNASFGSGIMTILKYTLGIRSLYLLVSKLRSALVSGFQNLAQYSVETNASISSLMSALTRLKNSFATAFAPILNVVAPILTKFINLLAQAVTYVGMFIAALTGQKKFTKAVGVQEDYAASLKDTSDNAKDAKKSLNNYLSSLDEVTRYETNSNSDSNTDTLSGYKAPTAEEMFETVPIESAIKGIADKIRSLIKSEDWEGLGAYLASGINAGLQKVYDAINWDNVGPEITYFVNAFTRTFNSLVDNIDWDLLGRIIGAGINTIVNTLNLLIEGIDWVNLGKSFATGVMGLVDEVNWTNLGNLIGNKFMISWKIFYGFVTNLDYTQLGLAIANLINGAIEKIDLGMIASSLSTFAVGLLQMLSTAIKNTNWTAIGQEIANALRAIDWVGIASGLFDVGLQLINGILKAFGKLPLPVQIAASAIAAFFLAFKGYTIINKVIGSITGAGGVIKALGTLVTTLGGPVTLAIAAVIAIIILLIANWDDVKTAAGKLKDVVVQTFNDLKTDITNAINTLLTNIKNIWTNIQKIFQTFDTFLEKVFVHDWTEEFGVIGDIINSFLKTVSDVYSNLKQIFNGIIKLVTGAFTGNWKKAWEGIKDIFSGVFKGLVNIAKTPINSIIGAFNSIITLINTTISKLNSISFSIEVPDWVPGVGGSSWGFSGFNISQLPKIPYLATGAVIPPNAPFMAVLGDQKRGTNIEAPESLLRQIIRDEIGNQEKSSSGNYRFTAQINRRTVFDEIITEAKLRQMNSGKNPFELA